MRHVALLALLTGCVSKSVEAPTQSTRAVQIVSTSGESVLATNDGGIVSGPEEPPPRPARVVRDATSEEPGESEYPPPNPRALSAGSGWHCLTTSCHRGAARCEERRGRLRDRGASPSPCTASARAWCFTLSAELISEPGTWVPAEMCVPESEGTAGCISIRRDQQRHNQIANDTRDLSRCALVE